MARPDTYANIVSVADDLFYRQGFERTSFADIASVVNISRGNFYHHFKTKDDILEAVIERRIENTKLMLAQWQEEGQSPIERICCFIRILIVNQTKIMNYGCPVGALVLELSKIDHSSKTGAVKIFKLFHKWLKGQFVELGLKEESGELAMRLQGRIQGVATLASAFQNKKFVDQEVKEMCEWVKSNAQ